jgi:hypothetical protein
VFELAKGSQGGHVPFRDSLLTRLLKVSAKMHAIVLASASCLVLFGFCNLCDSLLSLKCQGE